MTAADRLREANGPGGYDRRDIEEVCDAADRERRLREDVRQTVRYLLRAGQTSSYAAAVEMLEDALGEEVR